jgi:hypothetical protein
MIQRRAAWAGAACLLATATLLAADAIRVTPLVVDDGRVFASFSAPALVTADARAVLKSGLLLTFTYTVEVRRPSAIWFDPTFGRLEVSASLKYDNLTSRYQVSKSQGDRVDWSKVTDNEPQALTWMTEFEKLLVPLESALEPNADYYLRVRARVTPRRTFSIWPFGGDDGTGRADFAYIR